MSRELRAVETVAAVIPFPSDDPATAGAPAVPLVVAFAAVEVEVVEAREMGRLRSSEIA